jgi:hypothetical protein
MGSLSWGEYMAKARAQQQPLDVWQEGSLRAARGGRLQSLPPSFGELRLYAKFNPDEDGTGMLGSAKMRVFHQSMRPIS